jgi:hypothetical protein
MRASPRPQAAAVLVLVLTLVRQTFKGDAAYKAASKACLALLFVASFVIR